MAPTATATPVPIFEGIYTLTVEQPLDEVYKDKVISFKIGDFTAIETAIWQEGRTTELDLTASSSASNLDPSSNIAKINSQSSGGTPLAGPLIQPVPPVVFQGTATVDNLPVSEGTIVTAWIDDTEVGSVSVVQKPANPSSQSGAGSYFSPLGCCLCCPRLRMSSYPCGFPESARVTEVSVPGKPSKWWDCGTGLNTAPTSFQEASSNESPSHGLLSTGLR